MKDNGVLHGILMAKWRLTDRGQELVFAEYTANIITDGDTYYGTLVFPNSNEVSLNNDSVTELANLLVGLLITDYMKMLSEIIEFPANINGVE